MFWLSSTISLLAILGLWFGTNRRTNQSIPHLSLFLHSFWLVFLVQFNVSVFVWTGQLILIVLKDGQQLANYVREDFLFSTMGLPLLVVNFLLSGLILGHAWLLAAGHAFGRRIQCQGIIVIYLIGSYLCYFQICRSVDRPTQMRDFFLSQFVFLVGFGWLYVVTWFLYRSTKMDPLFKKNLNEQQTVTSA